MTAPKKYPFLDLATVNAPYLDELEQAALRVVRSGRYIGGEEIDALERRIADIARTPHAVAVSNGLDALRLILRAYIEMGRLKPGDEVIVPANTYIASVLAISDAGLIPVLAEPDALTSNLDIHKAARLVGSRTRAIMPVHLYGRVCFNEELADMATRHNLLVIEDNAQAIGATSDFAGLYGTHATGGLGHAAGLSFYPTKNVGALGDAGIVTTHDPELAATVRALANYGADRRYHNLYCGFNCRMDSIQAAMLMVKLRHLDEENDYRRQIASVYCSAITNPHISLPLFAPDCVFHQFVVHTPHREAFTAWLDANGIGWDMHYATPPHRQPCYMQPQLTNAPVLPPDGLPVTERLADTCVSLPISRCTSPDDAHRIAEIINGFQP